MRPSWLSVVAMLALVPVVWFVGNGESLAGLAAVNVLILAVVLAGVLGGGAGSGASS